MRPSTSTTRSELLHNRLGAVGVALKRLNRGDLTAVAALRQAIRGLREALPVLNLEADAVRKLDARLLKTARRLRPVERIDALLASAADATLSDRRVRQAEARLKNELRRRRSKLDLGIIAKKTTTHLHKVLDRLGYMADQLIGTRETAAALRARRWAVKARAARRALEMKRALNEAGSVYVPGRLGPLRRATRRLLGGVDVLADVAGPVHAGDVKTLERMSEVLDRLRDTERLVSHLRRLQGALLPPELKVWQELDDLTVALEHRARRLHGKYVREREALRTAGDRLGARHSAQASARRKAS